MAIVMSIMLFIERVYMAIVILCVKVSGKKTYTKYKLEAMKEDLELNKIHPMVLVQIPTYNEKEVYIFFVLRCILILFSPKFAFLNYRYIKSNSIYWNLQF